MEEEEDEERKEEDVVVVVVVVMMRRSFAGRLGLETASRECALRVLRARRRERGIEI